MDKDEEFLKIAIGEAKKAKKKNRVPIGAVIVKNNLVIAKAYNCKDYKKDPTAHAEILAIRKAAKKIGPNLDNCVLYSTLQPCLMCLGAAYWAHIKKIVYGCGREADKKYFVTNKDLSKTIINDLILRKIKFKSGVLKNECWEISN